MFTASENPYKCRNPLEAGQKFNPAHKGRTWSVLRRNPLEAGQKFNEALGFENSPDLPVAIPLTQFEFSFLLLLVI